MAEVIGELLPLAVAVAVSPVPIIAVILMLLGPRARVMGLGFLAGWVAGILAAILLFTWLAGSTGSGAGDEPPAVVPWVRLVLGVLLILLSVLQWRRRPEPGQTAQMPKWMAAIDKFSPAKAFGLGLLLSAVNPKNLAMGIAGGVSIGGAALSGGQQAVAVAVFAVIAACTVALPVIAYTVAAEKMRAPLDSLKGWLQANNATVMSILLLVIGTVLLGKGIGGLS